MCAAVPGSCCAPARLNDVCEQVLGLLEITSATGKQIQICLDGRGHWGFGHESGVHEHAVIVGISEPELRSKIRSIPQFAELSVLRTAKDKNLHLINVHKGSIDRSHGPAEYRWGGDKRLQALVDLSQVST